MSIPIINAINSLKENVTYLKTEKSSKFYSSKLLNYIEPIEIGGFRKTVFYSEINTNFNIGDRVFVLNGNYDSNDFISKDKYAKYTDGYRVLGVDGCRIILDLDYTGVLPYQEQTINDFIKIYHVRNQREFDYVNSIKVVIPPIDVKDNNQTIGGIKSDIFGSKFSGELYTLKGINTVVLFSDSIIYVGEKFSGSSDPLIKNSGVSNSGYYVKNLDGAWINISTQVKENKIVCLNPNHNINGQIYISGEDINDTLYTNILLKQRNFYKFENGTWKINNLFKQPLISKLNFRYGKFSGTHNDGIFGTNIKRNYWSSGTWNSGIFVNSIWLSGTMNSKSNPGEKLYNATLKLIPGTTSSIPAQTIDLSNNRGFGYNFIYDSQFQSGVINNGNFINCNIGLPSSYSAVDIYFGLTQSFNIDIKGQFNLCDINSANISFSTLTNNGIDNSMVSNSKIINSQVISSSINESEISDSSGIRVLGADVWSYSFDQNLSGVRGILKLYISDEDLTKINLGDAFYISRINKEYILNNITDFFKVKLPLESKYILDYYFNTELSDVSQLSVTIKNKNDNKRKVEVSNEFNNIFSNNSFYHASIDIECSDFGFYIINQDGIKLINDANNLLYPFIKDTSSNQISTNINKVFTNTYLHNSDIKSGYINNSNWISSDNVNYCHNKINRVGLSLDISYQTLDTISINLPKSTKMNRNFQVYGEDLFRNDTVWINSISYNGNPIDGRYKVIQVANTPTQEVIYLKSVEGLTFSSNGTFSVVGAETANYTSINKLLINNSQIAKGLFVRTGFRNSTMFDSDFNNNDRYLNVENNSKQRFVNIIFNNTGNNIESGLVYASHFVNDTWTNGILYNSIWNGGQFNNGISKRNYWLDGHFNNGIFLDSNRITLSRPTMVISNSNNIINRYSFDLNTFYCVWLKGTFNLGEFYNSSWINGLFNNGKFYSSEWYSGTWSNGVLGNRNIPLLSTKFAFSSALPISGTQSTWINGIVDNAIVGGSGSVSWLNGKFNAGEFTSFGTSSLMQSTWYNGDFNGGRFSNLAKWKNGNFYKGNFISHYGHLSVSATNPSTSPLDYGWENGKFFGGVFGNANTGKNSIWYNGEFRGGQFVGRFWFNGIFFKGDFIGSGTPSFYESNDSSLGEFVYANSFTQNYYGMWYGGNVIDTPQNIKTSERVYTELVRKIDEKREDNRAELKNILWINGTFSHKNASFINSMWLGGHFNDGTFDSSIFNPFVDRQFTGSQSNSSFATISCIWNNGNFVSNYGTGSFYISEWKDGTFNRGYMSGAIWRNGKWLYGTAENIYWENGLWRNGNWNGSPFDYTLIGTVSNTQYKVTDSRAKNIILNISNVIGTSSIHINNGFSASSIGVQVLSNVNIHSVNGPTSSWLYDTQETYNGVVSNGTFPNFIPVFGERLCSGWEIGQTFSLNSQQTLSDSHLYTFGGQNQVIDGNNLIVDGYNSSRLFSPPRSSKLYACKDGQNTEVFSTSASTYEIRIKLSVELTSLVFVEFGIGNNTPISFTFSSNQTRTRTQDTSSQTNFFPRIYDVSFVYNSPNTFSISNLPNPEKQFWIRKKDGGILRILRASIVEKSSEYHPLYNNRLYSSNNNSEVLFPNDSTFTPIGTSDNGNVVSINFGNGVFKSGIWENGVWNNGYRSNEWFNEPDYFRFSDVIGSFTTLEDGEILSSRSSYNDNFTYKIDDFTWNICLQGVDSVTSFNVGDKVSIGNIVAINVNEERVLIKDYFRVTKINELDNTLNVQLITNFPVMRVEKDSDKHLIYLSKNIWLSGAFLNGYFKGIWNNGLFKGFPKVSEIRDSHFISGKFDGGRLTSKVALNTPLIDNYHTGLVQSFEFIDNNISGLIKGSQSNWKRYLSWMDLNYLGNTASTSNLNQDGASLSFENINTYPNSSPNPNNISSYAYFSNSENLMGSITYDVLDSKSSLRDAYSLRIQNYKLGSKFRKYENLTPNDGDFTRALTNNHPYNILNNANIGVNNLEIEGWTYSFWPKPNITFSTYSGPIVESNVNVQTLNKIYFGITQSYSSDETSYYISMGKFKFSNNDIDTIPGRYYVIELDLATISYRTGTAGNDWIDITNGLVEQGFAQKTSLRIGTNVNELFSEGLVKRQYFYNVQELKLEYNSFSHLVNFTTQEPLSSSNFSPETLDLYINNFSMIEVDKIPFFKYAEESDIDFRVKTPYFATAPFIDYSNSNFDFIGNVNLTFDSQGIASQGIQTTGVVVNSNSSYNGGFTINNDYVNDIQTQNSLLGD